MYGFLAGLMLVNVVLAALCFSRLRQLDHLAESVAALGNSMNETLGALEELFSGAQTIIASAVTKADRNQTTLGLMAQPRSSVASHAHRRSSITRTPSADASADDLPRTVVTRDATGEQ
jgi:hypothetical protein